MEQCPIVLSKDKKKDSYVKNQLSQDMLLLFATSNKRLFDVKDEYGNIVLELVTISDIKKYYQDMEASLKIWRAKYGY